MKIAAVQTDVKIFEKGRNLGRVLADLETAARAGAKLVVFPECALTGYCFASREEAGPLAETVPGPSTEKIAAAAKRVGCTVVVGMLERSGERIYNAAAVISPEGVAGTYRKVHLPYLGSDGFSALGVRPFPVLTPPQARRVLDSSYHCSSPELRRIL